MENEKKTERKNHSVVNSTDNYFYYFYSNIIYTMIIKF